MRVRRKDLIRKKKKEKSKRVPTWIKWSMSCLAILLFFKLLQSLYSLYVGSTSPRMIHYFWIYTAISFLYTMAWVEKENSQVFIRLLFLVLFPVIGLIYSMISDFQKKKQHENDPIEELNNIFSYKEMETEFYKRVDIEEERNILPLEEAILYSNVGTKRKLLINALKNDLLENLDVLNLALEDKDTETSHYAASAFLQIRGKLMQSLQEWEVKYEKSKEMLEVLKPYADTLKKCLDSKILDIKAQRKYQSVYVQVLEKILSQDQSNPHYFQEKINFEIRLKHYDQARSYCTLFHQYFPSSEWPFILSMKLYYVLGNKKELLEELDRLKASPVKLSHEGVQTLRFWANKQMYSEPIV